eukprot:4719338-Pyramimonas_sp.AAC.1
MKAALVMQGRGLVMQGRGQVEQVEQQEAAALDLRAGTRGVRPLTCCVGSRGARAMASVTASSTASPSPPGHANTATSLRSMRGGVMIVSRLQGSQGARCDDCVTPAGLSGCA